MLQYLALTIAVEIPIYLLFARKKIAYSILILSLANCFTWTLANFVYYNTTFSLWIVEVFVALTEAVILYYFLNQRWKKAILISSLQNIVTTFLGIWLNHNCK